MKRIIYSIFLIQAAVFGQEKGISKAEQREYKKQEQKSNLYTYEANKLYKENKPKKAEADYRKAISQNKNNAAASYNMGDLLYEQKLYAEAGNFFKEASMIKDASKEDKHKAYHNMGNVFMQQKQYDKAVMAYKEALRNNPSDDETRYNFALAKEFLKNNPPENQQNQDDKDNQQNQNQDNKDQNQDNKDNQDNKNNQNQDNKDQNQENQNQDKKQNPNQNEGNKDGQDKEDRGNESGQGDKPQKGQLSPQQAERILEAMNNEEKKTQEKINAQKVKGRPARSQKDW